MSLSSSSSTTRRPSAQPSSARCASRASTWPPPPAGREALEAVAQRPPAVIVLDVTMPDLDGVTVVRRLRADGIDVPVCILSARDEVEDRVAGLQAGADDYLVKPFAIAELTARLQALLRRRGARGRRAARGRRRRRRRRAATSPPAPGRDLDAHPARVRPARGLRPPPRPGALARAAAAARVGLRLRRGDERGRRVRRLRAPQARGGRRGRGRCTRCAASAGRCGHEGDAAQPARAARRSRRCWRSRSAARSRARLPARRGRARRPPDRRQGAARAGGPGAARAPGRGPLRPRPRARRAAAAGLGHVRAGRLRRRRSSRARATCPTPRPPRPRATGSSTVEIDGRSWRSLTIALGGPADARLAGALHARARRRARGQHPAAVLLHRPARARADRLAAWLFTTLAVRPLARLQAGAARVSGAEDLAHAAARRGSGGGPLARRRAQRDARRGCRPRPPRTRRFAADAGHELRTPLTTLRANLDALARNPGPPGGRARGAAARERRRAGPHRAPARRPAGARPRRGGRTRCRARTSSSATSSTPRSTAPAAVTRA